MDLQHVFSETTVPTLPHLSFCPATVHDLQHWCKQLHSCKLGDKSQLLLNALIELQRLQCSSTLRQQLATVIKPELDLLLHQLDDLIYQNQHFKFNLRYRHLIDLFLLLQAHYIAILLVVERELQRHIQAHHPLRWIMFPSKVKQQYTALTHTIFQLYSTLSYHQHQLHHDHYPHQWKTIHRLYRTLKTLSQHKKIVKCSQLNQQVMISLEQLYLHLILFSLLVNHQLNRDEITQLYQFSIQYCEKLELTHIETSTCKYKISLQSDCPAFINNKYIHQQQTADYLIDCESLMSYLTQHHLNKSLSLDLMFHIQQVFIHQYARKDERYLYSGQLEVYVDYHHIYPFLMRKQLLEQKQSLYHLLNYQADVLDKSLNGYRLRWNDDVPSRLNNGILLLIREKNSTLSSWQCAIVRWIKHSSTTTCELGIEILSHYQFVCDVLITTQQLPAIFLIKHIGPKTDISLIISKPYDPTMITLSMKAQIKFTQSIDFSAFDHLKHITTPDISILLSQILVDTSTFTQFEIQLYPH